MASERAVSVTYKTPGGITTTSQVRIPSQVMLGDVPSVLANKLLIDAKCIIVYSVEVTTVQQGAKK